MRKLAMTLLAAVLAPCLAAPFGAGPARAQSPKPVVGHLLIGSPAVSRAHDLFVDGLRTLGHEDGQSLVLETRWAHSDNMRWPRLARELIERAPAVIVAPCGPPLQAIRELSRTMPVVANCADERNFLGEVASFARPGGYTTGVTLLSHEAIGKRIELLKEVVPRLSRLTVLYEPSIPMDSYWRELERLQPVLGLAYQQLPVARPEDLEAAFPALAREGGRAVFVLPTPLFIGEAARISELARKHGVVSVFELPLHVVAGGLMSYGANSREYYGKSIPLYVDKILKGAKPAELPIIQPTQFELVVNLGTARALGLEVPPSLLARADRVIE